MLKESQGHQKTIFEYAPKSNAAKDYGALVDEITQEEG
jgi:nitrogenase subunit NifH